MMYLGFEPWAAENERCKVQMNPLSYGSFH